MAKSELLIKERLSKLLSSIISTTNKPSAYHFINVGCLETALSNDPSQMSSLMRWIKGQDIPDSENAFTLGETLATFQLDWLNGLTMLWMCGRHKDFVGTFNAVATRAAPEQNDVLNMYLQSLHALMRPHPYDNQPQFLDAFLRGNPMVSQLLPLASDKERLNAILFMERERAKDQHREFSKTFPNLQQYFRIWQPLSTRSRVRPGRKPKAPTTNFAPKGSLDYLLAAALDIAGSTTLSLSSKATTLAAVLSYWAMKASELPLWGLS